MALNPSTHSTSFAIDSILNSSPGQRRLSEELSTGKVSVDSACSPIKFTPESDEGLSVNTASSTSIVISPTQSGDFNTISILSSEFLHLRCEFGGSRVCVEVVNI